MHALKGIPLSEEHKRKIGDANRGKANVMKGQKWSVEIVKNMSIAQKKRFCEHPISDETKLKMSLAKKGNPSPRKNYKQPKEAVEKQRQKMIGLLSGNKNPAWKGGKTPINAIERHSYKVDDWRKAVFNRDGFRCQLCGNTGIFINAHHIKLWSEYPNERHKIDNGITVCQPCHYWIHSSRNTEMKLLVNIGD